MNAQNIKSIDALEILDSRGNPTLRVTVELENGRRGTASVPSGASTAQREAIELRDGDPARYGGKGELKAVSIVREVIQPKLRGFDVSHPFAIDDALIVLDGTENKSRLGANAILGVSMAAARAAAMTLRIPLYAYLGGPMAHRLPVPMMNVINGGMHADSKLDFQEFMIVPHGASTFAEALRHGAETFHALKSLLRQRGYSTAVGDEGGFAPQLREPDEACDLIMEAIQTAGLKAGTEVAIALDPAASSFFKDGQYRFDKSGGGNLGADELGELYRYLVNAYPIVSVEDGFAEDDWQGFRAHCAMLGGRIQIVGDDLYATNPALIARGVVENATNAALIKLNQIGTVAETVKAIDQCRKAGWGFIISHRSGETEDTFIADFSVAMGGGQIKAGSLCRSERLAKYNRLLEIERELGASARYESPFRRKQSAPEAHDAIAVNGRG